jgi:ribosomal-protein-alanine N-acetyltransferase
VTNSAFAKAQPTLATPRLRLRPYRSSDASDVQRLASVRAVADTTLRIPNPYPDGAAESWIAGQAAGWTAGEHVTYAITTASDAALVGTVGISISTGDARAELGYWIAERVWGQGYATEAAGALCAYAFARLDVHRIQAHHFVRNPASGRVMQKLGMTYEGLLRAAVRKAGRFEDLALYAVLRPEWATASAIPLPDVQ